MNFKNFVQISYEFWEKYLRNESLSHRREILNQSGKGNVWPLHNQVFLYPTILVCTETNTHFVSELVGSREDFDHLKLARNRIQSIYKYFYQFDVDTPDPGIVIDNCQYVSFEDIWISHPVDVEMLLRRFPFLDYQNASRITTGSSKGSVFDIRNETNFLSFHNCMLVNSYSSAIRMKHILQAIVIKRTTNTTQYFNYLGGFQNNSQYNGIQYVNSKESERLLVASEFANIFLFPGLRETTIGEFFKSHPGFTKIAFNTPRFVYEPYLEWQEGNSNVEEKAINPDLLIQRPDGNFDIYDLKLPMLNRDKLTKGRRSRRRFVDYVAEGRAQLAHYANYFEFPKNRDYAFERYQISINDPHCVLVVGNYENVNRAEIDEARRMLKNFEIIDYDTLLGLYLKQAIPNDM